MAQKAVQNASVHHLVSFRFAAKENLQYLVVQTIIFAFCSVDVHHSALTALN